MFGGKQSIGSCPQESVTSSRSIDSAPGFLGRLVLARRAARFSLTFVGMVMTVAIAVTVASVATSVLVSATRVLVTAGRRFLFGRPE